MTGVRSSIRNLAGRGRRRRGAAVAVFLTVALGWAAGRAGADGSAARAAFAGLAVANGARVTYTVPNYAVVETPLDSGGTVAQAALESSGLSRAFASMPYPGDLAVTAPGTLATFGLAPAGALSYPFYVAADHPSVPEGKFSDPSGSLALQAGASPRASSSTSRVASGSPDAAVSGTEASTSVTLDDGGAVVASATSVSRGIEFGAGALRIAAVRSRSVTRLPAGAGAPVSEVETVIDGASINDVKVAITPEGISFAGQPSPVPLAATTKAMNDALAQAGLSLAFVHGPDVKGGRAADAVEIRSRHPIPLPGQPEGFLTFRFGGATTSVLTGDAGVDLPSGADVAPSVPPAGVAAAPDGVAAGTDSAAPAGAAAPIAPAPGSGRLPVSGSAGAGTPLRGGPPVSAPPGGDIEVAAPGTPVEPAPAGPAPSRVLRVARDFRDETGVVYGVLAGAGLLLLANALGWRTKGVSSPWTIS